MQRRAQHTESPLAAATPRMARRVRKCIQREVAPPPAVVRRSYGPASDHDSFAEHNRIFAAIEERNANEAQAAMRTHLISVSKRLFGDD